MVEEDEVVAENKWYWRRTRWWWRTSWRRTNGGGLGGGGSRGGEGQMGEKNKWWRRTNGGGAVRNGREQVGEGVRDDGERGERSGGRRKEEREKVFLCVFVSDSSLSVSICLHMSASANINIRHSATRVVYTTGFERLGNPPTPDHVFPFCSWEDTREKNGQLRTLLPMLQRREMLQWNVYVQSILSCV